MRFLQGLGAALIMPLSLAVDFGGVPTRGAGTGRGHLERHFGLQRGAGADRWRRGGGIARPWEWIFLINVPIGIIALLCHWQW